MKANHKSRELKPNFKHKRPQKKTQGVSPDKENTFRELPRIRSIKPEFFVHLGLFDAEKSYSLPLRVAFMGLVTCCDSKGCFRWQPRRLKLYTIPYDEVDMEAILAALLQEDFIQKYTHQGQCYGVIPSFLRHQKITAAEPESIFPSPQGSFPEIQTFSKDLDAAQEKFDSEIYFGVQFLNPVDKNFDKEKHAFSIENKNLELAANSLDVNFQKNDLEISSKPLKFSPLKSTPIEESSKNINKNNEVEVLLEATKNENQSPNFNKKKFIFTNTQGKEGKGMERKGAEGKGTEEKGAEQKGREGEEKKKIVTSLVQPRSAFNPIQQIFQHWKTVMNHPHARLDPKRKKLIAKALKLGYSAEELQKAISGCSVTPHNIGDNERGQRFDGLHVILRDADQIDRFVGNYHAPPRRLTDAERNLSANAQVSQSWLEDWQEDEHGPQ